MKLNSDRYIRQLLLEGFGEPAQLKLQQASVLVVGAGGLGVPVMQYLTGMGVGKIGIIDNDVISESNLHRQVLYSTEEIGKPKVQVAAKRLRAMNPEVEVVIINDRLNVDNALLVIGMFDVVVDCTDNFQTRYLINDACVILDKPFVYGAIHKFEGQISVFNFNGSATYRCLFPSAPEKGVVADCNTNGVLGILPGIIGCYQANEVVKLITGVGEVLVNKLLMIDTLKNSQFVLNYQLVPVNKTLTDLRTEDYKSLCTRNRLKTISAQKLAEKLNQPEKIQLVDVRELDEWNICNIQSSIHIPLNDILFRCQELDKEKPVVLICHHGIRSLYAGEDLLAQGFEEVYNLAGGIDSWSREVDEAVAIY
ncbi:HesA/MoeB/ThiF family protein [Solitalea canadensis]|uniref:Molybdopterin-synthase adenylyltransferase n=1 Tax=Solitalea canadensis (strain ATCC 29591 / DSM 3403 / JCM 21819 / LMG 8368 / NBRC 15130 / NCIMB 12057 / USAM 9D) TaxID=929556 RepID=H8KW31_SOLCM|nr:HesA/MoeB/ThiF family protein [Solitalea canadensis]AFD07052.1 dinucleotide-utilizing enzyme possibly involved in molybdopterin or thiamin biosynthesis [Solitalea canadensis DSM 3403]